ncbi:MAG TPA: hypothetical protein DCM40_36065 [Maribacter sp.]|nr:hypothetical protein [Maribacter sp.]
MTPILQVNQPFRLVVSREGVNPTDHGFATFDWFGSQMKLYEIIDLNTFPSFSDFKGSSFMFSVGNVGTVIKLVGRPRKIKKDPVWCMLDVYEVLIAGKIVQLFRQNMEPI